MESVKAARTAKRGPQLLHLLFSFIRLSQNDRLVQLCPAKESANF